MDYIPYVTPNPLLSFWILIPVTLTVAALVAAVVGMRTARSEGEKKRRVRTLWASPVLIILAVVSMVVIDTAKADAFAPDRAGAIQEDIAATYGLELTRSQVEGLRYPHSVTPPEVSQIYGSVTLRGQSDAALNDLTVVLVWQDQEMLLAKDTGGGRLVPLKVVE